MRMCMGHAGMLGKGNVVLTQHSEKQVVEV